MPKKTPALRIYTILDPSKYNNELFSDYLSTDAKGPWELLTDYSKDRNKDESLSALVDNAATRAVNNDEIEESERYYFPKKESLLKYLPNDEARIKVGGYIAMVQFTPPPRTRLRYVEDATEVTERRHPERAPVATALCLARGLLNPDLYDNKLFADKMYQKPAAQMAIILQASDELINNGTFETSKDGTIDFPVLSSLLERIDELGGDIDTINEWIIHAQMATIPASNTALHENFKSLLTSLAKKRDERLTPFPAAKAAASQIIRQLKSAAILYFNIPTPSLQDVARFQEQCKAAVSQALEEGSALAKHRSLFGEALGALFAGLKHFFAACINHCKPSAPKMDFWNTQTDTLKMVVKLQADLENLVTDIKQSAPHMVTSI